jgi:hypothetical protein
MSKINTRSIIHKETVPFDHMAMYPFAVTIHTPGPYPLTIREQAVLEEAIINAAHSIKIMRGNELPFAWTEKGVIKWDQEL